MSVRCPGVQTPVVVSAPVSGADVRPGDHDNVGLRGEIIHVLPPASPSEGAGSEEAAVSSLS